MNSAPSGLGPALHPSPRPRRDVGESRPRPEARGPNEPHAMTETEPDASRDIYIIHLACFLSARKQLRSRSACRNTELGWPCSGWENESLFFSFKSFSSFALFFLFRSLYLPFLLLVHLLLFEIKLLFDVHLFISDLPAWSMNLILNILTHFLFVHQKGK